MATIDGCIFKSGEHSHSMYLLMEDCIHMRYVLINTEIPKVTYYYVLILNLNLKCIINFLKVISIS